MFAFLRNLFRSAMHDVKDFDDFDVVKSKIIVYLKIKGISSTELFD